MTLDLMLAQSRFDACDRGTPDDAAAAHMEHSPISGQRVADAVAALDTHWRSHMLGCHHWNVG